MITAAAIVCFAAIAICVGIWDGRLVKAVLGASLSRAIGGSVRIDRFEWRGWGDAALHGVTLTSTDWSAPGAQIGRVDSITLSFEPRSLIFGPLVIHDFAATGLALTLVDDPTRGSIYNFQTLTPAASKSSGDASALLERVRVDGFALSFQRVVGDATEPIGAYAGSFSLHPSQLVDDRSEFTLQQSGDESPWRFHGWIDQRTLAFEVNGEGLSLSKKLAVVLPGAVRALAEASEATGKITSARLSRSAAGQFSGAMDFEGVRATLPNDLLGRWVRYERGAILPGRGFPRFEVDRGSIEISDSTLSLRDIETRFVSTDAAGGVATLPVRASFTADFGAFQRQDIHWEDGEQLFVSLQDALPFELDVSVDGFVLGESAATAAIELPEAAAQFLKTFAIEEIKFDLGYKAARPQVVIGSDGFPTATPINTSGTLVVTNGKGGFAGFPYPLTDVAATVRFTDDRVEIADLRGEGPSHNPALMRGVVTNITKEFGVDLLISTAEAPIDGVLIDSFPPAMRTFLGSLFWREGFDRLRLAGALAGPDEVDVAKRDVVRLEPVLALVTTDSETSPAEVARLATELGRARRTISRGAFSPGGKVAFTVRVTKAESAEATTEVTGSIKILEASFLPRIFPYPLRATGGEIAVLPDRVDFGDGITFSTLDGATGLFKGVLHVAADDLGPTFRPDLEFLLKGEKMNELLVMAIPPDDAGQTPKWPGGDYSEGGKLLSMLDLRGTVSMSGKIGAARDGSLDVDCSFTLSDGSIHPHLAEDDPLYRELLWPTGFGLDNCEAQVRITEERVALHAFTGLRGHGLIEASGFQSLVDNERDFQIRLRHVDLAEYAVNLVPHAERIVARDLWGRYKPVGVFDADLHLWSGSSDAEISSELEVRPEKLAVTLPDGSVSIDFQGGSLSVEGLAVTCQALTGVIHPFPGHESLLCLDGSYGESGSIDLAGSIENALIESPVVRELMRLVGSTAASSALADFDPHGGFDANFWYASKQIDNPGSYQVDAFVSRLAVGDPDGRLALVFDPPAHVHANSGELELLPTEGRFLGGTIAAAGWWKSHEGAANNTALFDFHLLASGMGEQVVNALPRAAREPLRGLGLVCPDFLEAHAEYIVRPLGGKPASSLDAKVTLRDAAMTAPPTVTDLDATFEIGTQTIDGANSFTVAMDDGRMRLARRQVNDAALLAGTNPLNHEAIDLSLVGSLGTGRMELTANIDGNPPHAYECDVALAGCNLRALVVAGDGVAADANNPAIAGDPGTVDARFGLGGDMRGVASRRGRGAATILKADLARLPIALAILQVAQASLSFDRVVNVGEFEFTLDGESLYFDRFNLACKDLVLEGTGWMDTESGELALRLRNRGTTPILSDLLSGVANQLFQIDVRGTLEDPKGTLAPLPAIVPPPSLRESPSAGVVR